MGDTSNFDVNEKVNILFKNALGFPSTKETLPWFQETSIEFNNYIFGENILLDPIPSDPCFNTAIDPSQVNLTNSNFATSSNDWGIKQDSTGTIHKYSKLILDAVPNSGNNSYFKLDNSNNNILNNSLQFNTKWSGSGPKIYPYVLSNQSYISSSPNAPDEINQDSTGGNWFFDIKNGVIFFPDYNSSIVNNSNNKPVFSFYKYVGRKGISNFNISNSISSDLSGFINDICLNSENISNLDLCLNFLNNKISQLINIDISSLQANLDNSFNSLINDFSGLQINLDNSFISLTLDISGLQANLDSSFNSLTSNINNLTQDISSLQTNLDSSFSLIETNIENIETSFNYLSAVVQTICGSNFAEQIVDLSSNLNTLTSDISLINNDVNIIEISLNNIKNTINLLDNTYLTDQSFIDQISIIDNSFNSLTQDISNLQANLDSSINSLTQDLSGLQTNLDLSFNELAFDISNINNIINTFDSSYVSETSFNLLVQQVNNIDLSLSKSGNILNSDLSNLFVNDISQTFFEIITQQPHVFDSSGLPDNITSSNIILSWNFDKIIAKHNNLNIAQLSYLQDKTKNLPFIDNIKIDISGIVNNNQTGWINYNIINISNNILNYDISYYKLLNIEKVTNAPLIGSIDYSLNNILSRTDKFDLRIYGNNFSNNYPTIENRSLYFNNLAFIPAQPPSIPIFVQETIDNINNIKLKYYVDFTELNLLNSRAKLNEYNIDFSENETLSSIIYPINSQDLSENNILNNIDSSINFDISINNLRSGTKYNYKINVKNNLNDNSFSEFSNPRISDFTFLPNSNNINNTINTNINGNIQNISNPNFNNSNIIYINLSDPTHNINYSNSNIQNIEITNPNASTSGTQLKGYGKFIDNSLALVTINVSVNNTLKQTISFDGSFGATNAGNNAQYNYISLPSNSLRDIYYNSSNNKGFRLEGRFQLEPILNNNIVNAIGDASINPYILNYSYIRHPDVDNQYNQDVSYTIYIDDLSNNPILNETNTVITVNNVIYNMGIPSVQEFSIDFNRNYSNINSIYNYLQGTNIIGNINNINNTSATNSTNISILNTDIVSDGSYSFDNVNMENITSSYYKNINYNIPILTNNYNLTWTENAFNLFNNSSITINYNTNHFCDYNSFNNINNKINSSKLDLLNIILYEINNISSLSNDILGLTLTRYTSHLNQIKDYTLMYIDGKFKSDLSQNYPNIYDYSYNSVNITNDFSGGNVSYDLSGINSGVNNNGYKYIAFEIKKNPNDATTNGSYIFNNNVYNINLSNDNFKYLSIKNLLNDIFDSNTINNIFDINNNNAIGFCRTSLVNTNYNRIGNLKMSFNPIGGNWLENGGINTGYNGSLTASYGSKIENSNNGDYGIYINFNALNDDLTLFIGLKNS